MHHANWRRRGRERKKLVDYRPLFSATIGYETGRRKLPLRFQISIIKLDGIVHRRNRKTMNLRHILRLPLSLSLSFAPGRTMKHSSIHLRAPFSKFFRIFYPLRVRFGWSFRIHGKNELDRKFDLTKNEKGYVHIYSIFRTKLSINYSF